MGQDAFIYDAIRTPRGRGKPGGGLYEVKPIDLVTNLLEALKSRHDLDTTRVEDLILVEAVSRAELRPIASPSESGELPPEPFDVALIDSALAGELVFQFFVVRSH